MGISKEFILAEMEQVQAELQKAQVFVIQAETSLSIYRMLLAKLDELTNIKVKAEGTD
jgi:hypothetical protein